jgi:hypothetical protein
VPGRADGRRFTIRGFVGYVPPPAVSAESDDTPWILIAAGGAVLVLLVCGGYLAVRRR